MISNTQVPKTSTSADVISAALNKSRRDESESAGRFVLVEETDLSQESSHSHHHHPGLLAQNSGHHNGSKKSKGKRRRVLEADENVYLVSTSLLLLYENSFLSR